MKGKLELAEKIADYSVFCISSSLRFMLSAVVALELSPDSEVDGYVTDGKKWLYSPTAIIEDYLTNKKYPSFALLHSLLHCLSRHMYKTTVKNEYLWDLACDISVAKTASELDYCLNAQMISELEKLSSSLPSFTADRLYCYFEQEEISNEELSYYSKIFKVDEHGIWYAERRKNITEDSYSKDAETPSIYKKADDRPSGEEEDKDKTNGNNGKREENDAWDRIARRVKNHAEPSLAKRGKSYGNLSLEFGNVTKIEESFTDFLEKFSSLSEVIETDDSSFDYIFYTYGIELYGNMPLIEPLEYMESNKLKSFVVAIDTSGSIDKKKVLSFLEICYSVLAKSGRFAESSEIRLLQCDSIIQEEIIIKSEAQLNSFMNNINLYGFGGTDFRPVFNYIESIADSEGAYPDGLIYFTDGDGVYPEFVPAYPVAFIIDNPDYKRQKLPIWAMKYDITQG